MCRLSIAIIWFARVTRSSLLTWDFFGAAAICCRHCRLSAKSSSPTNHQERFEAVHFIYENVAGMGAAVCYLEDLGNRLNIAGKLLSRRAAIEKALTEIQAYEQELTFEMLDVLRRCGALVYGITDTGRIHQRVPTLCFNLPKIAPARVTEELAQRKIGVRDGHMYAPRLMKRLGLAIESGAVRASLVHYNAPEEVREFGNALGELHVHR